MTRYICLLRASDGKLFGKELSIEEDHRFFDDSESGNWSGISQMLLHFRATEAEALLTLLETVASQEHKKITANSQALHIEKFKYVITELARQINTGSQKNP